MVLVEEYDQDGNKEVLDPIRKKVSSAELKERKVGRVVTPGTLVDESWLSGDESRYLLAIAVGDPYGKAGKLSLAYADASTGEFFLKNTDLENIEDELARVSPREVVLDSNLRDLYQSPREQAGKGTIQDLISYLRVLGVHVSFSDPHSPPNIDGISQLSTPMSPNPSLESLAIATLRHHLQYALRDEMPALTDPTRQASGSMMQIDAATLHALEIRHAVRPGGMGDVAGRSSPLSSRGTLVSVLSRTVTPGGHRLLIRTLTAPSTDLSFINSRLSLVEGFVEREELRLELRDMIRNTQDVMRIIQRFKGRRGDGRDAWEVGRWIRGVSKILDLIRGELSYEKSDATVSDEGRNRLQGFLESFRELEDLAVRLEESIDEVVIMRGAREDDDGMEEAGNEMLVQEKPRSRKEAESRKEQQEREREEEENAKWWMKPR